MTRSSGGRGRSGDRKPAGRRAGTGQRALKERVKTAKGRKSSSTRWLGRQLNDPYVKAAKAEGLRSRAAFKLREIDQQFELLKPGMVVVDLGAAPGGWSQVAQERVGGGTEDGKVVALDIAEMESLPGVDVLRADFESDDALKALAEALAGRSVDLVMSDMAAPATGHRGTDHLRIVALCEAAYDFAEGVLAPGGAFLAKVLQGGMEATLLARLKKSFGSVRHVKPPSSRADSAELYVLATGFRGRNESESASGRTTKPV